MIGSDASAAIESAALAARLQRAQLLLERARLGLVAAQDREPREALQRLGALGVDRQRGLEVRAGLLGARGALAGNAEVDQAVRARASELDPARKRLARLVIALELQQREAIQVEREKVALILCDDALEDRRG